MNDVVDPLDPLQTPQPGHFGNYPPGTTWDKNNGEIVVPDAFKQTKKDIEKTATTEAIRSRIPRTRINNPEDIPFHQLQKVLEALMYAQGLPQLGVIRPKDIKTLLRAEIFARAHPCPIARFVPRFYLQLLLGLNGERVNQILDLVGQVMGQQPTTFHFSQDVPDQGFFQRKFGKGKTKKRR